VTATVLCWRLAQSDVSVTLSRISIDNVCDIVTGLM